MSKKTGFVYRPRSADEVKHRAERKGAGQFDSIFKQSVDTWRPKEGENVIRILPPTWDNHEHYGYDIWVHSYVGADKSTYLCPKKMLSKPCPICDAARDAKVAGEEDEAKALSASPQVAVWMIDRDDADKSTTPSIYTMSFTMDKNIAALCSVNKRTGKVLLIDHPDEGYDVMFTRTGKGLNTRYVGLAIDREATPILDDEAEQDRILEYIQENPIPDVLNFYSEDYLRHMIEGGVGERDEDLDDAPSEDSTPRRSARTREDRPAQRRRAVREVEDEEDFHDAPPRRRSSRYDDAAPEVDDDAPLSRRRATRTTEDDDVPPRRAARDSRRPARSEPDEEVDISDDDIEAPDEDDAPAHRPSRREAAPRRSARDEVEDVDDELPDEEVDIDDVDEAPLSRRAPARPARARR